MPHSHRLVTPRFFAMAAILFFLPTLVSLSLPPSGPWAEYPGIFFHLSILFLVALLDSPDWGRAAGYLWVGVDVLAGALAINHLPSETVMVVRLGGHIFAGIWLLATSFRASLGLRIVGTIAGVWLSGYTFVANLLPAPFLAPASILMVVWLIIVAVRNKNSPLTGKRE